MALTSIAIVSKPLPEDGTPVGYEVFTGRLFPCNNIESFCNMVRMDSVMATLRYLQNMGPRYAWVDDDSTTPDTDTNVVLNEVRDWLVEKLDAYSYTVTLHHALYHYVDKDPDYGWNVIATRKGTHFPDTWVVVGAHYDTRKETPGIDDNGSGTGALMELARIFQRVNSKYSIALIFFTGEERAFKGSTKLMDSIGSDMDIKVMFNIDQVGGTNKDYSGNPYVSDSIKCEADSSPAGGTANNILSQKYTDTLARATNTYTSIGTVLISRAYGSDYVPFERNGYVITGYYEGFNGSTGSQFAEKVSDTIGNIDATFYHQVIRGSVAYTALMAQCEDVTGSAEGNTIQILNSRTTSVSMRSPSKIDISLIRAGNVVVDLFDIAGKKILTLNLGRQVEGSHLIDPGKALGSKVMIAQVKVNNNVVGKVKMNLVRL